MDQLELESMLYSNQRMAQQNVHNTASLLKKLDADGNPILNNDENPILEQTYSVETGTVLTINTSDKKLLSEDGSDELVDVASSFTPQKMEFVLELGALLPHYKPQLKSNQK